MDNSVETMQTMEHPDAAAWGYTGGKGPANWGKLSPAYARCASGKSQSPIDLRNAKKESLTNVYFNYKPSKITLLNNGHTIQANYGPGSSITVDGTTYALMQFHFHEPAEHLVRGTGAAAELHLVHRSAEGAYAVVAVQIKSGLTNETAKNFWSRLPTIRGQSVEMENPINAAEFLPVVRTTYRYEGSLTAPPCSEGVKWMVMTQPIVFSVRQLSQYHSIFKFHTNRPAQPLHDRAVLLDTSH